MIESQGGVFPSLSKVWKEGEKMTGCENGKLNLTESATYQIRVPGLINQPWSDWFDQVTIRTQMVDEKPITDVIVKVDQAALQGLLRRLYNLGLPIISIDCVDDEKDEEKD